MGVYGLLSLHNQTLSLFFLYNVLCLFSPYNSYLSSHRVYRNSSSEVEIRNPK